MKIKIKTNGGDFLQLSQWKRLFGIISFCAFLFYASAAFAGRFVDNNNETVTDTSTGLMWQKASSPAMNYQAAVDYCKNLNIADKKNWRLPQKTELQSLVDKSQKPTIDQAVFPDTQSFGYWTSTSGVDDPQNIIFINFSTGKAGNANKSDTYYVRAVRAMK